MPEDQVAKRGSTVQLECRVKHDPSLKLTVSWLKDDEPLYISNRSLLLPPCLLLSGALPSPLLLVMRGRTCSSHVGVSLQNRRRGFWTPQGRPPPVPALSPLSALLLSPPSLLSLLSPSALSSLSFGPSLLLFGVQTGRAPASLQPSQQFRIPRQRAGLPEQALTLWLVGSPLLCPGPTPVLSLSQIRI